MRNARTNATLRRWKLTGSHIHVTGDDRSDGVLGQTGVRLGMNVLTIVLGTERREHEISV